MSSQARIGELVLRVPGVRRHEAQRLVDEVTRRVQAGLPATFQAAELGRLELRVAPPLGTSFEQLAERIARAILAQLRPGGRDA